MSKKLSDIIESVVPYSEDVPDADSRIVVNEAVGKVTTTEELEEMSREDKLNFLEENLRKKSKLWSSPDGEIITSTSNTFTKLKSGYYSIHVADDIGLYFIKEKVNINKLYRLPNNATNIVLKDIDTFWKSEEKYKKYERVYRRNYLLYSAPGTGKTSLINIMCKDLIDKYDGIVISLTTESEIRLFVEAVRRIRSIEGERKIIAVIEDIIILLAIVQEVHH